MLLPDELQEGPLRVGVAENDASLDLHSARQFHTYGLSVPHENSPNVCTGSDLRAEMNRGACDRVGDRPHSSPRPTPRPLHAPDVAEGVMTEDERGPWSAGTRHR